MTLVPDLFGREPTLLRYEAAAKAGRTYIFTLHLCFCPAIRLARLFLVCQYP